MADLDFIEANPQILLCCTWVRPRGPFNECRQKTAPRQVAVSRHRQTPGTVATGEMNDLTEVNKTGCNNGVEIIGTNDST